MESYARGETDTPLLEQTIGESFESTFITWPDREALVEFATGRRWTWAELNQDVDDLAIGLLKVGITKGDRVGMWAPNCAAWTITQYATAKIGAILVNVNPAYRTHELAYALKQSGTKLLISAEEFKGSSYRDMVDEVRGDIPTLEQVVFLDSPDWTALNAHDPGITLAEAFDWPLFPDDPINIQYTSGTTGYPKGATLSHRNILNNGYFTTELINFTEQDRLLHPSALLPLLRHGHGQPRLHLPWRHDGAARPGLRPRDLASKRLPRRSAPPCTAYRRCSSRCRTTRRSPTTTSRHCGPGSWPARSARSR